MAIEVCEYTFPACWASALVNNDYSGLSEAEAKHCRLAVSALARGNVAIVDVARDESGEAIEPRFTRVFDMYGGDAEGGDVLTYVAHKRKS